MSDHYDSMLRSAFGLLDAKRAVAEAKERVDKIYLHERSHRIVEKVNKRLHEYVPRLERSDQVVVACRITDEAHASAMCQEKNKLLSQYNALLSVATCPENTPHGHEGKCMILSRNT